MVVETKVATETAEVRDDGKKKEGSRKKRTKGKANNLNVTQQES